MSASQSSRSEAIDGQRIDRAILVGDLLRQDQRSILTLSLRDLLPICSTCKKIRDDRGLWNRIEGGVDDGDAMHTVRVTSDEDSQVFTVISNNPSRFESL
jgi:hypothetical protein